MEAPLLAPSADGVPGGPRPPADPPPALNASLPAHEPAPAADGVAAPALSLAATVSPAAAPGRFGRDSGGGGGGSFSRPGGYGDPFRPPTPHSREGLGWLLGVFTPVSCTIYGVVVFMRMGWVVGQAGFWAGLAIITFAFVVSLLTVLSLCALITNGPVETGAIYMAVRNSIGPELGGAIGILFYFAYCLGAAFYCTGFAETTKQFAGLQINAQVFPWNPPGSWITLCIASAANFGCLCVTMLGLRVSVPASALILVAIYVCIAISATCLMLPNSDVVDGHTEFSLAVNFKNNSYPEFTRNVISGKMEDCFSVFAIFFPGFTGVLAGANLSGDLADPSESIAKGSLAAIFVAYIVYVVLAFVLASTVERQYLQSQFLIMETISNENLHFPIVFVGICICTLSSALSYMMGAPRVMQALARDRVIDSLQFFAQTGWRGEPVRALLLTWAVTQVILLGGAINYIAPLMTAFFCLTFCTINLTCFLLEVGTDSFNPEFQLYSWWTALLGSILSFAAAATAPAWPISLIATGLFMLILVWRKDHVQNLLRYEGAAQSGGEGKKVEGLSPAVRSGLTKSLLKSRQRLTLSSQLMQEHAKTLGTDEADVQDRVSRAAAYVRDALKGKFSGNQWAQTSSELIRLKLLFHRLKMVRVSVTVVFLSITIFEQPSWCYGRCHWDWDAMLLVGKTLPCTSQDLPISGIPVFNVRVTQIVEIGCLMFFALEMYAKHKYRGAEIFWSNKWYMVQLSLMLVELAGVFLSMLNPTGLTLMNPVMRPVLFIVMSRRVRDSWAMLFRILPSFMDIVALGTMTIFIFAIVGTVMFEGTPEGSEHFPTIWRGALSLHILLTTANYPDVMMPAYSKHRIYFLFFMTFLLFVMYFIMNLVLATIYNNYRHQAQKLFTRKKEKSEEATTVAFHLLDVRKTDQIEIPIFTMLVHELERPTFNLFNYDTSKVTLDYAKSMIGKLHAAHADAGKRGVDRDLFSKLVASMVRTKTKRRMGSAAGFKEGTQRLRGPLARLQLPCCSQVLGVIVASSPFERFWDVLICLNTINITVQVDMMMSCLHHETPGASDGSSGTSMLQEEGGGGGGGGNECDLYWWLVTEPIFTALFTLELIAKVGAYSLSDYLGSKSNRFDCLLTLATLIGQVLLWTVLAPDNWSGRPEKIESWPTGLRALLILRLMRVLRLLTSIKRFEIIFSTFMSLLPKFSVLLMMVFTLFYIYAALGVGMFGGLVYPSNPILLPDSPNPDGALFGSEQYYPNNFNDFMSGVVTLFELMIVNNWFIIMNGITAASKSELSRIYFLSFWFVAVMILFNLVIAFVLDVFLEKQADTDKKLAQERLAAQKALVDSFDQGERTVGTSERPHTIAECDEEGVGDEGLTRSKSSPASPTTARWRKVGNGGALSHQMSAEMTAARLREEQNRKLQELVGDATTLEEEASSGL
jgi:potassium/chloride transporter 9